jgi:hypothetical protein
MHVQNAAKMAIGLAFLLGPKVYKISLKNIKFELL